MEAGITLMNEVGLDPGIDHMLAMECFDEVHSNGGKVLTSIILASMMTKPYCLDYFI